MTQEDDHPETPGNSPDPGRDRSPEPGMPEPGGWAAPGYPAPDHGYGPSGERSSGYGYAPPGGEPPGYEYAPPGERPSGYGYGPPGGPPPGYWQQAPGAPRAPKPGVVPLRPLGLGDILNGAFGIIRHNPRTVVGLSLIVMAFAAVLSSLASAWYVDDYTAFMDDVMTDPSVMDPDAPVFPGSPLSVVLLYTGELIVYFGAAVLLGLLSAAVGMSVLGHKLTPRQTWEAARGRMGAVIGLAALKLGIQFVMVTAAIVVLVLAFVLGFVVGSEAGGGVGFLVGLLVFLVGTAAVVAPSMWIWIRLYYAMPMVVLERLGPGRAMARSWRLSKDQWWRTCGYWFLTGLLVLLVGSILNMPFGIAAFVIGFVVPNAAWTVAATGALTYVGTVLVYAVTQPFATGVTTLLYVDLRMRREGLDLHLHGVAQAGYEVGPEVYLPEQRT